MDGVKDIDDHFTISHDDGPDVEQAEADGGPWGRP